MTVAWLIGRFDGPEVAPVADESVGILEGMETYRFATPGGALGSGGLAADLIFILQARPSEFSRRDVDSLLGSLPLARFVVGLGPWCASHGRSERLWPESVAVPIWDVVSRLRRVVADFNAGGPRVPLTAGREEALLARDSVSPTDHLPQEVTVIGSDRSYIESLRESIRYAGFRLTADPDAAVTLFDADPIGRERLTSLAATRAQRPTTRLIMVTAFPTASDTALLRRSGANLVLPKLIGPDELVASLYQGRS